MKKIVILSLAVLITACVQQWTLVKADNRVYKGETYQLELPEGWVHRVGQDALLISRDGPDLQKISIRASSLEDAFPQLGQAAREGMLPSELSALFIAETKKSSSKGLPSLKVIQDQPVTVAGHDGFRVQATYLSEDGLKYGLIGVGFVAGGHFYQIAYTAPMLVYFEPGVPVLEEIVASFEPG